VPEAYLTIANCQIEGGQKADGKKTLELVIKNYPDSKAAPKAAVTLVKLK
jgi:TolA-binding protein